MLKVKNITKSYGDFKAVDNLSFEVNEGEIFGLLGANGAGKTTTFRMIMNLIDPDDGSITLNNKKINYDITDRIGFLTEERSLLLKLTVKELMIYYGRLKSMTEEEIIKELDYWLDKFKITEYKNKKIKELSKGNKQKIQFISSIINKPDLLILDEPFSGLDPINIDMFIDAINQIKKQGTMIIFSSHQMNHVELFCEKLIIMDHGKVILSGYLKDIKKSYSERKILLKADTSVTELEKIDNISKIIKKGDEFELNIDDEKYINDIFKKVSNMKNVRKFEVVELSLHEIFTKEVGENHE